jgi:hypothetical protein
LFVYLVMALLGSGCGNDEGGSPEVQASPERSSIAGTVTPGATTVFPPPTQATDPNLEPFRGFADDIATAVENGDASFFVDRGVHTTLFCSGTEQVGQCAGEPAGKVFRGIPGSAWQSDAFAVMGSDEYTATFQQWFNSAIPASTDLHGSGAPGLLAIAIGTRGEFFAISSLISEGLPGQGQQRTSRVFHFEPDSGGGWDLIGEIGVFSTSGSEDWLSGSCGQCYDYWEPWTD